MCSGVKPLNKLWVVINDNTSMCIQADNTFKFSLLMGIVLSYWTILQMPFCQPLRSDLPCSIDRVQGSTTLYGRLAFCMNVLCKHAFVNICLL